MEIRLDRNRSAALPQLLELRERSAQDVVEPERFPIARYCSPVMSKQLTCMEPRFSLLQHCSPVDLPAPERAERVSRARACEY